MRKIDLLYKAWKEQMQGGAQIPEDFYERMYELFREELDGILEEIMQAISRGKRYLEAEIEHIFEKRLKTKLRMLKDIEKRRFSRILKAALKGEEIRMIPQEREIYGAIREAYEKYRKNTVAVQDLIAEYVRRAKEVNRRGLKSENTRNVDLAILNQIEGARWEIRIVSPWIWGESVLKKLKKKLESGVKVFVICRPPKRGDKAHFLSVKELKTLGASIRFSERIHAKFFIFDRALLILSSANLTESSLKDNIEAALVTTDKKMVDFYLQEFERLWHGHAGDS